MLEIAMLISFVMMFTFAGRPWVTGVNADCESTLWPLV